MNRRDFFKKTATIAAAAAVLDVPEAIAANGKEAKANSAKPFTGKLIASAPMLQNYAETSMGVAFAVNDMANGFVTYSEHEDFSDAKTVKCGGYRVTAMNPDVMQIRLTGLKPATKYYYRIGADHIHYGSGYDMKILGTENDPRTYSFTTAGRKAEAHFCVINDTHKNWGTFGLLCDKLGEINPSCVIWNGDASNHDETIANQKETFLCPPIDRKDYASCTPFVFCPGNHDSRGLANRHHELTWMFRQPEERSSRDWDLGRNFAIRMGDIALIGLDTAEDKVDENPKFAGLFSSAAYREAQVAWLRDALKRKDIASAKYKVAFCHIPLYDANPAQNPGNVHPNDTDPRYSTNYAHWQKDCHDLWTPLLEKAGCKLIITAHQHTYRRDDPEKGRPWAQLVGGGPKFESATRYPTVIEGQIRSGVLHMTVYNIMTGKIQDEFDV